MGKQLYFVNKNVFLTENEISFYLLGAYMTDGCILTKDKKFEICSKDTEWLEKIRDIICPEKPLFIDKRSAAKTLRLTDPDIVSWFNNWGCTDRKSKTLHISKSIPSKYIKDFLLGVLDGDGCVSIISYRKHYKNKQYTYKNNVTYICSSSQEFILQLKEMIPSNINCKIHKTKPSVSYIKRRKILGRPMYRLIFNGTNAIAFLQYIYSDSVPLKLSRKYQVFESMTNCSTSSEKEVDATFSVDSPT